MSKQTLQHILLEKINHIFRWDLSSNTKLTTSRYLDILKQGPNVWNQWRHDNQDIQPDLSQLTRDDLRGIDFSEANLSGMNLEKLFLKWKSFKKADLFGSNLQNAYLRLANLEEADLRNADLRGATLIAANLQGADLSRAHLEGADLRGTNLKGANLSEVFFDGTTRLGILDNVQNMELDGAYLADGHWSDVNLAVVNWSSLTMPGEELDAQRDKTDHAYEKAVRVNRQLAVALRNQGLSDEATRFAYQAQVLQREVFRLRISQWQKRKGAIRSLIRTLLPVGGIVAIVEGVLLGTIISSIEYQQKQCHLASFSNSHNTSCPSLPAQVVQLSPTLLVPTFLLFGFLVLSLVPLSYLRQGAQQSLGPILILFLSLLVGFLLTIVPLLLTLPPALQYLGSLLLTMDSTLQIQLSVFFVIWLLLFLLPSLPWLKACWARLNPLIRLGYTLIPLLLSTSFIWLDPHGLPLSSLLPEPGYMQFFPLALFFSPQFPFGLFPLLLFALSMFLPSLQEVQMFKVLWLLLLLMVLCWYLILASQLKGLAHYLQYYPLPDFQLELFHLGPLAPLVLSLLFLVIQPFIQRASRMQRLRMRVISLFRISKNTLTGYGQYTLSLFLDALAGYGYKPGRTLGWYIAVILTFATAYSVVGTISGHPLSWQEAFVFSLTSFHGRGFFPGFEELHPLLNPLVTLAALEAVVGLVIEVSFIATFTQRFFGK